jgi:hypothetical protein
MPGGEAFLPRTRTMAITEALIRSKIGPGGLI